MYRTKTCGELNINNAGEKVELAGWIQKKRNLGGMEFIDLRDEFGITQSSCPRARNGRCRPPEQTGYHRCPCQRSHPA